MVTVGMNYRVRAGKNDAFIEGFRGVLEVIRVGDFIGVMHPSPYTLELR